MAVLSCNRRDDLEKTLDQLFAKEDLWNEVIVVDNTSTDGSWEMVEKRFPDVKLVDSGGNIGTAGSNLAFEAATGDWILSLDDDSYPVIESLGPICEAIESNRPEAAIALSIRKKWAPVVSTGSRSQPLKEAFGFSGAGVLFNRKAIGDIGGYDQDLFLFTNELDWTARALGMGWRLASCDDAVVIHRSTPANRSSLRHAHYYCRNTLVFLMRYAPKPLLANLLSGYLRDIFLFTVLHGSGAYLRAFREARKMLKHFKSTPGNRLSKEQFLEIKPDLRAPFSYLG